VPLREARLAEQSLVHVSAAVRAAVGFATAAVASVAIASVAIASISVATASWLWLGVDDGADALLPECQPFAAVRVLPHQRAKHE
jgi:hypothetical protein